MSFRSLIIWLVVIAGAVVLGVVGALQYFTLADMLLAGGVAAFVGIVALALVAGGGARRRSATGTVGGWSSGFWGYGDGGWGGYGDGGGHDGGGGGGCGGGGCGSG